MYLNLYSRFYLHIQIDIDLGCGGSNPGSGYSGGGLNGGGTNTAGSSGSSNNGNTGNPSNGSGNNSGHDDPVFTTPVLDINAFKKFVLGLTDQQRDWLNDPANSEIKSDFENYITQQPNAELTDTFAELVIDQIMTNSGNPNILANDVIIIPQTNSDIISDLENYLSCFDLNQGAVFTIYVDQPTAGSNKPWSGNPLSPDVGHTFISIKQGNNRRVIGFYPANSVSLDNPSTNGSYHNNGGSEYDVSLSFFINSTKLNNLIEYIKSHSSTNYNINTNNCTDFGMKACNVAGVKLISAHGTWGLPGIGSGAGDNPGQLGENIRNMPVPNGFVKTTTSGLAPINIGN